jgi:hypothetical protein
MKKERWPVRIFDWRSQGRKRGQPEQTWIQQVQQDMTRRNMYKGRSGGLTKTHHGLNRL